MKMRWAFILGLILVSVLTWSVAAQQRTFLTIATGGTAGVYYPLGVALAELWSSKVPNVQAVAQTTGGSVANVNLLARGDVGIAFVQNDISYYAFHGIEMFMDRVNNRRQPISDMRGMAMLYPETIQIVTLRSKQIRTVADLRDKRVAVGAAGSGTEPNARQILQAYNLGYFNIREEFLNFAEAVDQLKDGVLDAAFLTAGVPTAAVADVAAAGDLMLVPVPRDVVSRLRQRYPYYTSVTIPANTYKGQENAVETAAVVAMLVTRRDTDAQLVYNLTRALWDNIDRLKAAHDRGKDIASLTARRGMPITMHAGALRYYRERDIR